MLGKLKTIVKDVMAVTAIRRTYGFINKTVLTVFGSSRLLATLYTIPGFITFNREQYAVLRGRRNYYRNLGKKRSTHVELRCNVHRLEKGIIMEPRKPLFAKDYIGETIEFYNEAAKQCSADPETTDQSEMEWSYGVLRRYFEVVESGDPKVDAARQQFEATEQIYKPSRSATAKVPFERQVSVKSSVEYDDPLQLSMQRRSVRWFKQQPVPRELIDKALLVGRQSPTACNRLPYEYKVFTDPELARKVAGIPFGSGGYSHQVPAVAVVVGKLDSYFSPRDRHAIYVDSSLASMSFMLALETLGLSSSVINWPDFEPLELKMQKTLGLDPSERVIMLIAIGCADEKGGIPFSQKKSLEVLRTYDQPLR